ncbi:MAG: hypothetical protein LBT41_03240 [Candidatus Methanoplasma sp.]|jgi:hypothetical protein|nr:hypothetical protein [Candidatus Methanoplasma sp.]
MALDPKVLTVVVVTLAVFVAGNAYMIGGGAGTSSTESSILGEWNMASCAWYGRDGELNELNGGGPEAADRRITVDESKNLAFSGSVGGEPVSGSFVGNTIYVFFETPDGWVKILGQKASEDRLLIAFTKFSDGEILAGSALYTRDGSMPHFLPYYGDVSGEWGSISVADSAHPSDAAVHVNIGEQNGAVFRGIVTESGSDNAYSLVGAMTMLENTPYGTGIAVDGEGRAWTLMERTG